MRLCLGVIPDSSWQQRHVTETSVLCGKASEHTGTAELIDHWSIAAIVPWCASNCDSINLSLISNPLSARDWASGWR